MPDNYEQSIAKLESYLSDDQICEILCSSNCKVANNKILNCLTEKLKCKEDLLDLCDHLEEIIASHDLRVIIQNIKSGVCSMHNVSSTYTLDLHTLMHIRMDIALWSTGLLVCVMIPQ